MSGWKRQIDIGEAEVIDLLRKRHDGNVRRHASKFHEAPLEGSAQGKVSDTVVSPGLKLNLKDDVGSWEKGSMWVVVDPGGRGMSLSVDQVLLSHVDEEGNTEDMVVLKKELDDKFEVR